MSSNLPPGCSDNEYGAPWNDVEFKFELKVQCSGSMKGPVNNVTYMNNIREAIQETIEAIKKIDNVDNVEEI